MKQKLTVFDPITGPLSREKFAELVSAPFGAAAREIRKHDPLFGRAEGEKIEWRVRCESTMRGYAYVKAASQEEADDLADQLTVNDVDWSDYSDDMDILSVEAGS